ncbi:hypothetical protein GS597_00445 [Synechococcales cyanobacterium C]|uniref:Uncharacterized protein n=1 Tax=Petrachloros mirabilis ULC683 TaxID=2781853 RepID=A0A8K2ABR1_9CYAN|nr:hypothetical protein [Petrachloros mirabilis]NCJ05013.1 hypothetical protein [Petrachloros mirabilis ULC683]
MTPQLPSFNRTFVSTASKALVVLTFGFLTLPVFSSTLVQAVEAEVDNPTVQCEDPNINVSVPDVEVSSPNPSRLVPNVGRILREGLGVPAPDSEAPDVGSPSASAAAPEVCQNDVEA